MPYPQNNPADQQIVHNTGTNYSLYYNVLNYFKTIMNNHPSIDQVSQGDIFETDNIAFPTYPLGNINITNSKFGTSTTDFNISIIVADKVKNKNNESEGERNLQTVPFYGVDDMVDIHANTLAILNDLTAYTQRGVAGFEINGEIECTPFGDRFNNGLAGWQAEFTLTTHNDKNRCLFFLVNPSGSGYIIQNCATQDYYKAVLTESGSIGQVFASRYEPNFGRGYVDLTTYLGLQCYTIVDTFSGENDFDFVNLPVLYIPHADFGTCDYCSLWISPQIWGTSPAQWEGYWGEIRKWRYV
jgi:hypothetical protein